MEKILVGTGNQTRLEYLKGILGDLEVELFGLNDLNIDQRIDETGVSPAENSKVKALGYYRISGVATLSVDTGLYIDAFPERKQPGMFVKRISKNRQDASDEEMLDYYISELEKYGGNSKGRWEIALTLVKSEIDMYTTVFENETYFTAVKSQSYTTHEPLNSIQVDPRTGKYVAELTVEEKKQSQEKLVKHIYDFIKEHYKK